MKNDYNIEHIIEDFYKKGYTSFLNPNEYMNVINRLPKKKVNIYKGYIDASKVIIYNNIFPKIVLCKIEFNNSIRHQKVLRELYELGLKDNTFGDIIIDNNIAYIYLLEDMFEYIKYNFELSNIKIISIDSIPLDSLEEYKNNYEEIELLVSSLRIDNVISSLINTSRSLVLDKFKNKEVNLNYNVISKNNIYLKEGDIFSIRRYGKYKYNGVLKETKKGSMVISISKYL